MKKDEFQRSENMKEEIKNYAKEVGVDDIGFASARNYKSPATPIKEIFQGAKTIIVLAFQQLDNCESENNEIASVGNKIIFEFAHYSTYKIARFIKKEFKAKVMSIPTAGPVKRDTKTGLPFADVSLRHAAIAAGLGNFGRHNLVIHSEMGSKVIFTAIITDLDIQPDTLTKELCKDCDICVNQCPVNALSEENKTDVMKCAFNSQPYGVGGYMRFWTKFVESSPEEQKKMLQDEKFGKLYQALSLGSYYVCFNCVRNCPAGQ